MSKQSTKTTIDANIKQNGVQAITGQIMNSVLNQMVDNLAEEASTTEKLTELESETLILDEARTKTTSTGFRYIKGIVINKQGKQASANDAFKVVYMLPYNGGNIKILKATKTSSATMCAFYDVDGYHISNYEVDSDVADIDINPSEIPTNTYYFSVTMRSNGVCVSGFQSDIHKLQESLERVTLNEYSLRLTNNRMLLSDGNVNSAGGDTSFNVSDYLYWDGKEIRINNCVMKAEGVALCFYDNKKQCVGSFTYDITNTNIRSINIPVSNVPNNTTLIRISCLNSVEVVSGILTRLSSLEDNVSSLGIKDKFAYNVNFFIECYIDGAYNPTKMISIWSGEEGKWRVAFSDNTGVLGITNTYYDFESANKRVLPIYRWINNGTTKTNTIIGGVIVDFSKAQDISAELNVANVTILDNSPIVSNYLQDIRLNTNDSYNEITDNLKEIIEYHTEKIIPSIMLYGQFRNYEIIDYTKEPSINGKIIDSTMLDATAGEFTPAMAMYTIKKGNGLYQVVAYYNHLRQFCVASREYNGTSWSEFIYKKLDEYIGYDGHKYLAVCISDDGIIHYTGGYHNQPLIYYKSSSPYNINTLQKTTMVSEKDEDNTTYPHFEKVNGELLFFYRQTYNDGNEKNIEYINTYINGAWKRKVALFNDISANKIETPVYCYNLVGDYPYTIYNNLTGYYELFFTWRTYLSDYNNQLCYVKTKDFVTYYNYANEVVAVPFIDSESNIIVDGQTYGSLRSAAWRRLVSEYGTLFIYQHWDNAESKNNNLYCILIKDGEILLSPKITNYADGDNVISIEGYGILEDNFYIQDFYNRYIISSSTLEVISIEEKESNYPYPSCVYNRENRNEGVGTSVYQDLNGYNFLMRYEQTIGGNEVRGQNKFIGLPSIIKILEFVA